MGLIVELLPIALSALEKAPQIVEEVQQLWALASKHDAPTEDQQAQIDAAFEAAHQAVQQS